MSNNSGVAFSLLFSISYYVKASTDVYMLNSNHVYLYPCLSSRNLRLLRVALALKIRFHSLLIRITSSGSKLMHVEETPIKPENCNVCSDMLQSLQTS